jgi:hypothetical protein
MITAIFVSIGPLLYLVVRGVQNRKQPVSAPQQS